jgi:HSP90 family molecular chaperone
MLTSCHSTQFHHEQCFNSYKHQIVKEWYITLCLRNIFHNRQEYLEKTRIMNILTSYSAYYMTYSIQNSIWISLSNSCNIWHQTRTPCWDHTNNMPQFEEKSSEALQKKTLQLFHQSVTSTLLGPNVFYGNIVSYTYISYGIVVLYITHIYI